MDFSERRRMRRRRTASVLAPVAAMAVMAAVTAGAGMTAGCAGGSTQKVERLVIGVTIVPQKAFVKAVCGSLADVVELVPSGYSPESYDPTPQQMIRLSKTDIFFTIDLPAEQNMDFSLLGSAVVVDLADVVSAVYPDRFFTDPSVTSGSETSSGSGFSSGALSGAESVDGAASGDGHDHTGRDPHIWLSPKRAIIMVQAIADQVSRIDPAHTQVYAAGAKAYISRLQNLDAELRQLFDATEQKEFIVYHPSFGYLAEDYGLQMLSLEENGHEATAAGLIGMIRLAKEKGIRSVFTQKGSGDRQPETFAEEIGGKSVVLDPLSEDYIANLRDMAQKIAEALHGQ